MTDTHVVTIGEPLARAFTAPQRHGLLYALGHVNGGAVILEREPDSDHGWIEVLGTEPGPKYAIWKHTGAVHVLEPTGLVSDDPVWTCEQTA